MALALTPLRRLQTFDLLGGVSKLYFILSSPLHNDETGP